MGNFLMNVKSVTLILTKRCNLRCNYCYVNYNDNDVMSLETAQTIIAKEMQDMREGEKLVISFLGGEPFTAFYRLKEICEWVWNRHWKGPYYINAITNGTLFTDEVRSWLIKNHKRFYLTLSFDGESKAQDHNRCGSSAAIDLEFFHKYWPTIPIKMTITEDVVSSLYKNIISLNKKGILVNDTFADKTAEWSSSSLKILDQQLLKLSRYYLDHPEIKPSDLLDIDLTPVLIPTKRPLFACGAGKDKITYDIDGKPYICHLLSPLALSKFQIEILKDNLNNPEESYQCSHCILDPICSFCPGMSFISKHTCWIREKKNCSLFRHQVYYACYFQLKRILAKRIQGQELNEHEMLTYLSIKYLSNNNVV